jgi:hypothetical protein
MKKDKLVFLSIFAVLMALAVFIFFGCARTGSGQYLEDHELTYRGLTIGETTVEELLETFGEPVKKKKEKTPERVALNCNYKCIYNYVYDGYGIYTDNLESDDYRKYSLDLWSGYGVNFVFYESYPALQRIYINQMLDYPTPCGINIGDLFENVLEKLALQPNMKKNISDHKKSGKDYTGLLYGNWPDETGYGSFSVRERGRRIDIELINPKGLELHIVVRNQLVKQIQIGCY